VRRACTRYRAPDVPARDGTTLHQPVFQVQPSGNGAGGARIVPGARANDGCAVRAARPHSFGRHAGPNYAVIRPGREPARRTHAQTMSGVISPIRL